MKIQEDVVDKKALNAKKYMDKNEEIQNPSFPDRDPKAEDKSASEASLLPTPESLIPESVAEEFLEPSLDNIDPDLIQTPKSDAMPFVSHFKQWIKSVAIVVLLVFVPDQISWAFSYNPTVLYKNLPSVQAPVGMNLETAVPHSSLQVAGSVEYLLKQIQDKEQMQVNLSLDDSAEKSEHKTLVVDTKTKFTKDSIAGVSKWLSDPNVHPETCGVYSLQGVLAQNNINRSLEEISVLTVSTDLMANIIKVGEPKLKTTLFSISRVGSALGLDYKILKVDPKEELALPTPFIASVKGEHFVTVKSVTKQKVSVEDLGQAQILNRSDFEKRLNGFVYSSLPGTVTIMPVSAPDRLVKTWEETSSFLKAPSRSDKPEVKSTVGYEIVPESLAAFVWGDKWRDKSSTLPGLVNKTQLFISLAIEIITALLPFLGFTGIIGVFTNGGALAVAAAQFAGDIATICQLKGACSAKTAFILQVAITVAITAGAGAYAGNAAAGAAADAGAAGTQSAASASAGTVLGTTASGATTVTQTSWGGITSTVTASSGSVVGAFVEGFALGVVKGYVQYEVYKLIANAICKDQAKCSDTQKILSQTLSGIVAGIASNVAVSTVAYVGDNLTGGAANLGNIAGADTKGSYGDMMFSSTGVLTQAYHSAVAQLAGMAVRIVASKAGLEADSSFSYGLGQAVSGMVNAY